MSQDKTPKKKIMQLFNISSVKLEECDLDSIYHCLEIIDKTKKIEIKFHQKTNWPATNDFLCYRASERFLKDYFKKINTILNSKEFKLSPDLLIYFNPPQYYEKYKTNTGSIEELQKDQAIAALFGNNKLVAYLIAKEDELTRQLDNKQNLSLFAKAYNFFMAPMPKHSYLVELLAGVILSGDVALFEKIDKKYHTQMVDYRCKYSEQMNNYLLAYAFRSEKISMIESVINKFAFSDRRVSQSIGKYLVYHGLIQNNAVEEFFDIRPYESVQRQYVPTSAREFFSAS